MTRDYTYCHISHGYYYVRLVLLLDLSITGSLSTHIMSASSGIGVSRELTDVFASSVDAGTARFIKVVIEKGDLVVWSDRYIAVYLPSIESLIAEEIVDASGRSLEDDIEILQNIVDESTPAYILARIGSPGDGQGWLAISYVPDTATIRGKVHIST